MSKKPEMSSYEKYRTKLNQLTAAWSKTYSQMVSDFAFVSGGTAMWERNILTGRQDQKRPIISLPLLQPYVDKIVTPIRMHPPGMVVRTADKGMQELVNGVIRGIEKASSATDCYSKAIKCAATAGLGWLYLAVEEDNKQMVLRIKSTSDPTCILLDPMSTRLDGADAQFACYHGYMGKDHATRLYGPDAGKRGLDMGFDQMSYNIPADSVLDCIWYVIEDGGMRITRTVGEKEVFNEFYENVNSLPVVPVIGEELFGVGGRKYGGIVRRGRDVNTSINITASNIMELVALAPKSPWIGAAESFEQYKDTWATANSEPNAYIPYKHIDKDGNPLPMPQRLDNAPQTQGLQGVAEWMQSLLGRVTGINDSMLGGVQTAMESGKALLTRMEAAEGSTAQYTDHLMTSIAQLARVLIQMLPLVYNDSRSLVIIDDDGKSARVRGDLSSVLTPDVVDMLDVEVDSGPQMELRRKGAGEALTTLISTAGDKGFALLDLWVETQDLPNSQKVLDRIKKMMPPELQETPEGEQPMDPRAIQAMQDAEAAIAEKDQALQYMEGQLAQLQQTVNSQQQVVDMELRKVEIQSQTQLEKAHIEAANRKEIEFIKQGSEDTRLSTKLTLEQQKHIDKMMADMMALNSKQTHENQTKVIDATIERARVPQYVQKQMNAGGNALESNEIDENEMNEQEND
jgi:hypothetical protein